MFHTRRSSCTMHTEKRPCGRPSRCDTISTHRTAANAPSRHVLAAASCAPTAGEAGGGRGWRRGRRCRSKSKTPLNSISSTATSCVHFMKVGSYQIALNDGKPQKMMEGKPGGIGTPCQRFPRSNPSHESRRHCHCQPRHNNLTSVNLI